MSRDTRAITEEARSPSGEEEGKELREEGKSSEKKEKKKSGFRFRKETK
jgi:hypothetical protein